MSNEDRSLSTPKKGDPDVLVDAKDALANAIINNAELDHPAKVAPATGTATSQDAQIMRDAVTNRANGGADPVEGRTQFRRLARVQSSETSPERFETMLCAALIGCGESRYAHSFPSLLILQIHSCESAEAEASSAVGCVQ